MADTLDLDPEWGAIDVIEELETVFNFNMTDEEAEGCCTVGDVYDVVCSHTSDWEVQGGNCASAMTFYGLRKALAPNDKRSLRPSTDLDTLGLTPSAFFDLLAARSNLRLPSHSLDKLGVVGSCLLFPGGFISIVTLFNSYWSAALMFAIVACAGLLLIWRDPGRWPNGIQTFGDLTRRTAPLNVRTLKEAGGKPSDRWSILTAIASEHGHLEPDAISPETFLHKKSMDEALAA